MSAYGTHYCDADLIPSPGPWKFELAYLKDVEGRTITILGREPTVGDLRLIEAAPELLALAQDVAKRKQHSIPGRSECSCSDCSFIRYAQQLIAGIFPQEPQP